MIPYVLRWEELFRGPADSTIWRERFAKAGRRTSALLVAHGAMAHDRVFESDDEGHAEENLLRSDAWAACLDHSRIMASRNLESVVTIVVNRTPCHGDGNDAPERWLRRSEVFGIDRKGCAKTCILAWPAPASTKRQGRFGIAKIMARRLISIFGV